MFVLKFLSLILAISFFVCTDVKSDVLWPYNQTTNFPGYISFDFKSDFYKGPKVKREKKNDGIERRTPSEILLSYLTDDGRLDGKKLQEKIDQVASYEHNAFLIFCADEIKGSKYSLRIGNDYCSGKIKKKHIEKWEEERTFLATSFSRKRLDQFKKSFQHYGFIANEKSLNTENGQLVASYLLEGLEAYEGARNEDAQRGVSRIWTKTLNTLIYHSLKGKAFESSNLLVEGSAEAIQNHIFYKIDEKLRKKELTLARAESLLRYQKIASKLQLGVGQKFFSENQLEILESEGIDLGILYPADSGLWRKPKVAISQFNTSNYHQLGHPSLLKRLSEEEVENLVDPKAVTKIIYKQGKIQGGLSPKLNGKIGKQNWKLKFITNDMGAGDDPNLFNMISRALVGSEVNVEPAVNNLAAALGFSIDPTYFKREVHLYLPGAAYKNEKSFQYYVDLIYDEIILSFREKLNMASAFTDIRVDSDQKKYFVMKSVTLEKKSDKNTDTNLGGFVKDAFGRNLRRDHRGAALFMAWVGDPDVKDGNAKLKLAHSDKESQGNSLIYSLSDMGLSFGYGLPNNFKRNLVKKVHKNIRGEIKKIDLDYSGIYNLPILESASFSDAKWFVTLAMQLSREQIFKAFEYGGYPHAIATLYTDILLRRRDQLVAALELDGTTFLSHTGEEFTFSASSSKMVDPLTYSVTGYEHLFFNGNIIDSDGELFDPSVEPFPRYWDRSFGSKGDKEGKSAKDYRTTLFKTIPQAMANLILPPLARGTEVTNQGIEIDALDLNLSPQLFDEGSIWGSGFKAGLDAFIPYRLVVKNPFYDAHKDTNKYWIVDVLRLGILAGAESTFTDMGLESPISDYVGLSGELAAGYEWVKIRPTSDISNLKELMSEIHRPIIPRKKIKESLLENLKEGDILVTSSYVGPKVKLKLSYPLFFGISVGIKNSYDIMVTNRSTLYKQSDDMMFANWSNLRTLNVKLEPEVGFLFIKFPFFNTEFSGMKREGKSYLFDLGNPVQKDILFENIGKVSPKNVPEEYLVESNQLTSRGKGIGIRTPVFNVWGINFSKNKVEVITNKRERSDHFIVYEREMTERMTRDFVPFERRKLSAKAIINEKGEMYMSYLFKFSHPKMEKKKFLKVLRNYRNVFPKDFLLAEPESFNYYLGSIEMESNLVISSKGIKNIFSDLTRSDERVCVFYAVVEDIEKPGDFCFKALDANIFNNSGNMGKVRRFIKKFGRIREDYLKDERNLETRKDKRSSFRFLKRLVSLISMNGKTLSAINFLASLATDKEIHREAYLRSPKLRGITGRTGDIRISDKSRGKFRPIYAYDTDSPLDYLDSFVLKVLQASKVLGL
ncbi:MAG: hypothetical protein HOE90_19890 [Bacteriovoracaceae bacterium]|jgi:hypothetical protein|nr:hypothetical protein [Bacteriovoracaceae bacterium]